MRSGSATAPGEVADDGALPGVVGDGVDIRAPSSSSCGRVRALVDKNSAYHHSMTAAAINRQFTFIG